jgi:RNA polymerase sigma factor (sigma-70 family)
MMQKDYNVTVKVRNARILNALAKVDEKAGGKLAKKLGVSYQQMLALINLKIEPVDKHGDWLPSVVKLAELTNTMPVELFSDAQYYPLDVNVAQFEMGQEEVMQLLNDTHVPDPSQAIEYREMQQGIDDVLDSLTPREAEVLRLRFGIDGKEHTMEEAARVYDVSRERIRQIEAKALRKLRHPSRADILLEKTRNKDAKKLKEQREIEETQQRKIDKQNADIFAAHLETLQQKREERKERKKQREFETKMERERTQWHSALSPPPEKDGLYERRVDNRHAYCLHLDGVWLIGDTTIANALAEMLHKRPSTYTNTEWREIPKNNMTAVEKRLLENFINNLTEGKK